MSASLVGSEMCIRDRQRAARGSPRAEPTRSPPRAGRPRHFQQKFGAAVSYTHLTLPTICSV
eukprot:4693485-Alexandrium_andersonii.AAC.1